MSLTRREFLRGIGGILAAGVAPAFIGSNVLMPVKVIRQPTLTEIIQTTLRREQDALAENIMRTNELLRQLKAYGLIKT